MGGVYGTTAWAVSDQFRTLTVFHAEPNITAGYGTRSNVRTIRGVVHLYSAPPTAEGIKAGVPSFQGLGKGNAVVQKRPFLWARVELPVGDFIEWNVDIYRVVTENQWQHEGNLSMQGLEKVVGLNGTQSNVLAYNTGANTFD